MSQNVEKVALICQDGFANLFQHTGVIALCAKVPAGVKQLPAQLERDARLACARGKGQQDAALGARYGVQRVGRGVVLIVAGLPFGAAGFERNSAEAVAPRVRGGKTAVPQGLRAGRACERAGRLAERLETREKANDVQRQMLEAAARRPRDRNELAQRLRDGSF